MPNTKSLATAAQVDGPAHYSYNTWKAIGGTVMKRRLLELQGWTVVPIPFFEWDMVLPWQRQVRVPVPTGDPHLGSQHPICCESLTHALP